MWRRGYNHNVATVGVPGVAYGGCAIMKREVEFQQVKVKNKIAYAEAVMVVKQKGETKGVVGAGERSGVGRSEQPGSGKMWTGRSWCPSLQGCSIL